MEISFSVLMIRCIVVTIVFGIFGYLGAETIKNAIACSEVSRRPKNASEDSRAIGKGNNSGGDASTIDIKVPPMDDMELSNLGQEEENEFVEMNPAYMSSYNQDDDDQQL
ncbi:MAG: hypothetical protein ACM3TR_11805 [Caulobacteraceae bacterium]